MSESDPSAGLPRQPESISFDKLSESAKKEVLGQCIIMLSEQGHRPFDSSQISEAIGADQARLIGEEIDVEVLAQNLSDDQIEKIIRQSSKTLDNEKIIEIIISESGGEQIPTYWKNSIREESVNSVLKPIYSTVVATGVLIAVISAAVFAILGHELLSFPPLLSIVFLLYAYKYGIN